MMTYSSTNREPSTDGVSSQWTRSWRRVCSLSLLAIFLLEAGSAAAQGAQLTQVVKQADPTLRWVAPATIPYGTALGPNQLAATAAVAGTFLYTPSAGSLPVAGTQTLSVAFTPTNPGYRKTSLAVKLTVTSPGSSSFQIALANPHVGAFTVSARQDTNIELNILPIGDFHQPVILSCSPPTVLTCTITPAIVRPTTVPMQVTLTLRDNRFALDRSPSSANLSARKVVMDLRQPMDKPPSRPVLVGRGPLLACAALLACFGMRRRCPSSLRRIVLLTAMVVLLPISGATIGCGTNTRPISLITITGSSLVDSKSLSINILIPPQ